MRKSCFDCSRKHLGQAIVIAHELQWYAGNSEDDHFWVLVGHLAEAGDQIQKESPFIADAIRTQRLVLMNEGAAAVHKLTLNLLVHMVTELADSKKVPAVLGVEPDADSDLV